MDEREARKVQREASEALLDLGVSLPLKEWRLPFMKRPVQWRVTMRRPRLAGQIWHREAVPLDGCLPRGGFRLCRA